jgi:hypothetical protein
VLNIKENLLRVQLVSGLIIFGNQIPLSGNKLSNIKGKVGEFSTSKRTNSNSTLSNVVDSCFKNALDRLDDYSHVKSYRDQLKNRSGIYSIFNRVNGNQHIGKAKDIYIRFLEHIAGKKSNSALQAAIEKYNLSNFTFYVFEFVYSENKLVSNKEITNLETKYIAKFDF